jgi:hypothetical protein
MEKLHVEMQHHIFIISFFFYNGKGKRIYADILY